MPSVIEPSPSIDPTVSLLPSRSNVANDATDTADPSGTDPPDTPTRSVPAEIVVNPS